MNIENTVYNTRSEWSKLFEAFQCDAPPPHEIISQTKFGCIANEYVKNKDYKGKVAYGFTETKGGHFILTVQCLKGGSERQVFNSYVHRDKEYKPANIKFDDKLIQRNKEKALKKEQYKQKLFEANVKKWEASKLYALNHTYALNKKISHKLKLIDHDKLAIPLYNIDDELKGIQLINEAGEKRIYGKMKGNFYTIGDRSKAKTIYVCEGFATGDAIHKLDPKSAVVVALCIANLKNVTDILKDKYAKKEIILCPDNDYKKKDNAGLKIGYDVAIKHRLRLAITNEQFSGSDWNDAILENEQLAKEVFEQRADFCHFTYLCKIAESTSKKDIKFAKKILRVGFNEMLARMDEQEIIDKVQSIFGDIQSLVTQVKRKTYARFLRDKTLCVKGYKKQDLEYFPIFPDRNFTTDEESIAGMQATIKGLKQDLDDYQIIFINKAPMGRGKTKHFINHFFKQAHNPIVITPRRSLTRKMATDLNAVHYSEQDISKKINNPLAITINSLSGVNCYRKEVFIEEYSQIMQVFQDGGTVRSKDKKNLYNTFMGMISSAKYVYIADADINDIHVKNIIDNLTAKKVLICPIIFKKNEKKIEYVIHNDNDQNFKNKLLLDKIVKKAELMRKIYISSDSKTTLKVIHNKLKKITDKILFVNQDNVHEAEQQEFMNNPDEYLKKVQILICSPSVQSGLSIEKHVFDDCFGIYQGVVKPIVFRQMLHRVRNATKFNISIKGNYKILTHRERDANIMVKNCWEQFNRSVFDLQKENIYKVNEKVISLGEDIKVTDEEIIIKIRKDELSFDKLIAELQTIEIDQMASIETAFIVHAVNDGVKISYAKNNINKARKKTLRKEYKEIKNKIVEQENNDIINATDLFECMYRSGKGTAAQRKRYEIKNDLKIDKVEVSDIEFHADKGASKVKNYQHFAFTDIKELQEKERDDHLKDNISKMHLKWDVVKVQLLNSMFNILGMNKENFKGEFTSNEAQNFKDALLNNESFINYVIYKMKLNPFSKMASVAFVNKIIYKLLGVEITSKNSTNGRKYFIKDETFMALKRYHLAVYEQQKPYNIYIKEKHCS